MRKLWVDAQRRYREIIDVYPGTVAAPEAMYWEAVSQYKATNDHAALQRAAHKLKAKYGASIWAAKASVWS
jgi:TolA-binding protein